MLKFILGFFINKDTAIELIEENQEKIESISEKNPHISTAIKTGFKIWSFWKMLVLIWWCFVALCVVGVSVLIYWGITTFVL